MKTMRKIIIKISLVLAFLIKGMTLIFCQNNTFIYVADTTKKDKNTVVNLRNLDTIIVKNNGEENLDVLFVLKGANGKTLWEIKAINSLIKGANDTIKIDKINLNKYLNLNQNLYLDEDVSSTQIMRHEALMVTNSNNYDAPLFPFQDALIIAEELRKKNRSNGQSDSIINVILSHYCGAKSLANSDLYAIYSDNAFIIKNVFPNFTPLPKARAQSFFTTQNEDAPQATSSVLKTFGNTVGGINATIVADAFAKIIIKRFKQDLNEIFFEKMREEMEKNVELKTLLPRTYDGLKVMDKDIFKFNQFLEGLRQKMEEDLANIFSNTNDLLETEKYKIVFKENQTLRAFLTTVSQFSDGLIRKQHPSVVIDNLQFSDAYNQNEEGKNLKAHLQMLQLFSRGLRANNSENWVQGLDNLNLLFKNDAKACQIWLGLMHRLAQDENGQAFTFENGKTLKQTINKLYDERNGYYRMETYVKGLVRRVNQINRALETTNQTQESDNKVHWDKLISLYDNTIALVKFAPTLVEVFDTNFTLPRNWHKGIYIAEALPHIYTEMQSRNYNAAVQHIVGLVKAADFRDLYMPNFKGAINSARIYQTNSPSSMIRDYAEFEGKYIKDTSSGKLIPVKKLYLDSTFQTPFNNNGLDKFVKYASFTASLVLAKTSDEVANLLETTMVPSGSTRMKEYGVLWGINSYLGFQYVGKAQNGTPVLSISAPIGLNVSVGLRQKSSFAMTKNERVWDKIKPHNVQLLFALVDVGAIVGLRFNNTQDDLPKIKLENIFSPGVLLQFGRIFKLPLNIGVGFQSQPRLYGINGNMLSFQPSSFKLNFNINWDIPLWNFSFKEFEGDN
jgi:uncharacterized protein (UPF0297 family)